MYDYLIVGSGLFGATFAFEATKRGKKCLVLEKRPHTGGNIYCETIEGIRIHAYGPHIFHTSNKETWDYLNQFVDFNKFVNSPIANYKGEVYNLPFNMNTFNKLWGVVTPEEAEHRIKEQRLKAGIVSPRNLEEQAISLVGTDIYEKLIKGYTEKQWGRSAKDLPAFIIKRLPVRFTYDNNYFNDTYQGVPVQGYNQIIDKMLEKVEVRLNVDYFDKREQFDKLAHKTVFTGCIDEFYNYCFGHLEYRSLMFNHVIHNVKNYQGNAVVNYTDSITEFTRVIEHKHFEFGNQEKTVITYEYPCESKVNMEPFYPINDVKNKEKYSKYKKLADAETRVLFGGRLADYKYYDMNHVVEKALLYCRNEFNAAYNRS